MKTLTPQIIENVNGKLSHFFADTNLTSYINGPFEINCVPELDETGQVLLVLIHMVDRRCIKLNEFEREISNKIREKVHFHIHFEKDFMGNVLVLKFQTQYSLKFSIVR